MRWGSGTTLTLTRHNKCFSWLSFSTFMFYIMQWNTLFSSGRLHAGDSMVTARCSFGLLQADDLSLAVSFMNTSRTQIEMCFIWTQPSTFCFYCTQKIVVFSAAAHWFHKRNTLYFLTHMQCFPHFTCQGGSHKKRLLEHFRLPGNQLMKSTD